MSNQEFERFQVYTGKKDEDGRIVKDRGVGMAYLPEGQETWTLKLWMIKAEKYYLLPRREEPNYFLVLSREENRHPNAKRKYFWNVVGNGVADLAQGHLKLTFDLLDKPLYMALYPERMPGSSKLAGPEFS